MGNRSTIKKYISFSKFRNFLENLPRALKKQKKKQKQILTKSKYAVTCLTSTSNQIPWYFPDFSNILIKFLIP